MILKLHLCIFGFKQLKQDPCWEIEGCEKWRIKNINIYIILQKKKKTWLGLEDNLLVLCYTLVHTHTHTHTHWSWKLFHATLKYAENKCCPLISRNSDLAHVTPLHWMVKTTYYPLAILQSLLICKSPFILTFSAVQVTMVYRVFFKRLNTFRKMLTLEKLPP